ncbi:hypothetical protein DH09_11480 [Bacillaceae bacterium JMAK1]|nr:hypothetical protein DH09_11480 [Bacillaceae bacterium JMAK1]
MEMGTTNNKVMKKILLSVSGLLLATSAVLLLLRESGTNQFGSVPPILTIIAVVLIIASVFIRSKNLKKAN